jgi:hypothetical protein
MNNFKGVVLLTESQYNELKENGRITIDDVEYFFDDDYLYVTPSANKSPIIDKVSPTSNTIGEVGQLYLDTTAQKLYICVAINKDDELDTIEYVWHEVGGDSGVSQEDFNKLVNNEIQIVNAYNSVAIGGANEGKSLPSYANYGVAIGYNADISSIGSISIGRDATSSGSFVTTIGYQADGSNYAGNIAIGFQAIISDDVKPCIQLGRGTNNTDYSLQIYSDNIYNYNTHTLTVQNIELNGEDLASKLGGNAKKYQHNLNISSGYSTMFVSLVTDSNTAIDSISELSNALYTNYGTSHISCSGSYKTSANDTLKIVQGIRTSNGTDIILYYINITTNGTLDFSLLNGVQSMLSISSDTVVDL